MGLFDFWKRRKKRKALREARGITKEAKKKYKKASKKPKKEVVEFMTKVGGGEVFN